MTDSSSRQIGKPASKDATVQDTFSQDVLPSPHPAFEGIEPPVLLGTWLANALPTENLPLLIAVATFGNLSAVVAYVFQLHSKIYAHEHGLRLSGLPGTQTLAFEALENTRFTVASREKLFTTLWRRSSKHRLKFRFAPAGDPFNSRIIQESARAVARNAFHKVVALGDTWHWQNNLSISLRGLKKAGDDSFTIPPRKIMFIEEEDIHYAVHQISLNGNCATNRKKRTAWLRFTLSKS